MTSANTRTSQPDEQLVDTGLGLELNVAVFYALAYLFATDLAAQETAAALAARPRPDTFSRLIAQRRTYVGSGRRLISAQPNRQAVTNHLTSVAPAPLTLGPYEDEDTKGGSGHGDGTDA
jgi:hypothetical protein